MAIQHSVHNVQGRSTYVGACVAFLKRSHRDEGDLFNTRRSFSRHIWNNERTQHFESSLIDFGSSFLINCEARESKCMLTVAVEPMSLALLANFAMYDDASCTTCGVDPHMIHRS